MSLLCHPIKSAKAMGKSRSPSSIIVFNPPMLIHAIIFEINPTPTVALSATSAETQDLWTKSFSRVRLQNLLTGSSNDIPEAAPLFPEDQWSNEVPTSLSTQDTLSVEEHREPDRTSSAYGPSGSRHPPQRFVAKYREDEGSVAPTEGSYQSELEPWKLKLAKRRATKRISMHHPEWTRPFILAIHNNLARNIAAEGCQKPTRVGMPSPVRRRRHTRPALAPLDMDATRSYKSDSSEPESPPESSGPPTPKDLSHLRPVFESKIDEQGVNIEDNERRGAIRVVGRGTVGSWGLNLTPGRGCTKKPKRL
ncbi:hypothetical protein RhiJN_10643 [Ceratobasidium sp. AG-Ba]|nr:hypothetical protein RhiJN_10643 [Ceratobasidium sp. AG-Ba]